MKKPAKKKKTKRTPPDFWWLWKHVKSCFLVPCEVSLFWGEIEQIYFSRLGLVIGAGG